MIFVILGTQDIQFNRLLIELDRLAGEGVIREAVFAQTGYSTYVPQHFMCQDFITMGTFEAYIEKASIIISHGGAGSLIASVKSGKKVIGIPRRKKYGEHVNDHQVELIEQFASHGYILAVMEMDGLREALEKIEDFIPEIYQSGNAEIIHVLEVFLEKQDKQSRTLAGISQTRDNL